MIEDFCCKHIAGDQKAVNIKGSKISARLLKESFEVYVCNNKARRAAAGVLEDALKVVLNAYTGCSQTMEDRTNILFV